MFLYWLFEGIRLTFRTLQRNALLFFTASPGVQDEFVVIQLAYGRLWFLFDPQGSTHALTVTDLLSTAKIVFWLFVNLNEASRWSYFFVLLRLLNAPHKTPILPHFKAFLGTLLCVLCASVCKLSSQ